MKKTLSIIMALCMVLSVCFFSVSAAEATVGSVATDYTPAEGAIAITDAAGFADMEADGNYYLANDITLSATWNANVAVSATYDENTAFTGTFDGNGKTITTSAPLFANLQGTVKNLVIEGDIDAGGLYCGSVSMWTAGNITVENVYNKVNITNGGRTGGILGYGETGTVATFINCRNDGDIQATDIIGGIAGYVRDDSVTITDCVNYGNFETENYAAGIIGRFGKNAAVAPDSVVTITGCVNHGKIVSAKSQTAGILGYLVGKAVITNCKNYGEIENKNGFSGGIFGISRSTAHACSIIIDECENHGKIVATTGAGGIAGKLGVKLPLRSENYYISNCVNFGDIEVTAPQNYTDGLHVGGLVGYAYGNSEGEPNGIINCINYGDVVVDCSTSTGITYVAGLLGYVNSSIFEMKNNINAGNITVTGTPTTVALTVYNKSSANESISNNYSVAIDGIDTALAGDPAAEASAFATAVTADKLASGEVAYLINEAAGEIIYYQTIGTDEAPVLKAEEDGSNVVIKSVDGAYVNDSQPTHQLVYTEAQPATLIIDGNLEYWYCTGCCRYFTDADAKNSASLSSLTIHKDNLWEKVMPNEWNLTLEYNVQLNCDDFKPGDIVTMGPISMNDTGYVKVRTHPSENTYTWKDISNDVTKESIPGTSAYIIQFEVPEIEYDMVIAYVNSMFRESTVITVNAPFTADDYLEYVDKNGLDIRILYLPEYNGGFVNVFPKSDGVFAGRLIIATVDGTKTVVEKEDSDYRTSESITVKEGDLVCLALPALENYDYSVGFFDSATGYVFGGKYDTISYLYDETNNCKIDAVVVPKGATSMRIVALKDAYENGDIVVTVNQPLTSYNDYLLCKAPPVLTVNGEYTYNGSPIKPDVTVKFAGNELKEGVDYTITCENNVNAGTATVTATLIGNYSGSISKEFTIAPREVVLVWENTDMMYNGERQTPTAKLFGVVAGDVCDVTVSGWGKFGGTYTAKVESISNENYVLSGDTTCQFTIIANPIEVAIDVACDIYDIIPDSAKQAVADAAVEAAKNAASDLANAAYEVASDLADTAIEAAETKAAEIKDTVESAYDQARDFFTGLFGSFSFFG